MDFKPDPTKWAVEIFSGSIVKSFLNCVSCVPYVPVWSTCSRANAPTRQKCAITCHGANKLANVPKCQRCASYSTWRASIPACQKWYQFFNFTCQNAYRFFNFSIFQLYQPETFNFVFNGAREINQTIF